MEHEIIEIEDGFKCKCTNMKLDTGEALRHQKSYRGKDSQTLSDLKEDNTGDVQEEDENDTKRYYKHHSGYKWERNRSKAKERDNHRCVDCGMTDEEHKQREDMFGEGLHVHHKKPVRKFDDPENAHKLSNLVTVCDKHHRKRENS